MCFLAASVPRLKLRANSESRLNRSSHFLGGLRKKGYGLPGPELLSLPPLPYANGVSHQSPRSRRFAAHLGYANRENLLPRTPKGFQTPRLVAYGSQAAHKMRLSVKPAVAKTLNQ